MFAKSTNTTNVCLQDLRTGNLNPHFFKSETAVFLYLKSLKILTANTKAQPYVTEQRINL